MFSKHKYCQNSKPFVRVNFSPRSVKVVIPYGLLAVVVRWFVSLCVTGGRVILACRDLKAAYEVREKIVEETFNTNVVVKHLDLGSIQSITKFAQDINSCECNLLIFNLLSYSTSRLLIGFCNMVQ